MEIIWMRENIIVKMKKQLMTLKPEEFKLLKIALGKDLKDRCDFCGVKITSRNYGYLAKNTVSCKNIICLTEAIEKDQNIGLKNKIVSKTLK